MQNSVAQWSLCAFSLCSWYVFAGEQQIQHMLGLLLLTRSQISLGSVSMLKSSFEWTGLLLNAWFYCFLQPSLVPFQRSKASSGVDMPQMGKKVVLPSRYELYINIYWNFDFKLAFFFDYGLCMLFRGLYHLLRHVTKCLGILLFNMCLQISCQTNPDPHWCPSPNSSGLCSRNPAAGTERKAALPQWGWAQCWHSSILLISESSHSSGCLWKQQPESVFHSLSCFFCFCSLNCMVSWCLSVRS